MRSRREQYLPEEYGGVEICPEKKRKKRAEVSSSARGGRRSRIQVRGSDRGGRRSRIQTM